MVCWRHHRQQAAGYHHPSRLSEPAYHTHQLQRRPQCPSHRRGLQKASAASNPIHPTHAPSGTQRWLVRLDRITGILGFGIIKGCRANVTRHLLVFIASHMIRLPTYKAMHHRIIYLASKGYQTLKK